MDALFIPGWLITDLIVADISLILLVKGYVNAKRSRGHYRSSEATSLAWESWLYDSLSTNALS